MDGVDVAAVRLERNGFVLPNVGLSMAYPRRLQDALRTIIANPAAAASAPLEELATTITRVHCAAVRQFFAVYPDLRARIRIIGCHGQTIWHNPAQGETRQLFDGALAAKLLQLPVMCDFRSKDVRAGGQGAPLLPLYHLALLPHVFQALYSDKKLPRALAFLNIGGVANVTFLPTSAPMALVPEGDNPDSLKIMAFDTGPGNALLDDFMLLRRGLDCDAHGALAARGRADERLVAAFMNHPYFLQKPPKSLDRNAFHGFLDALGPLSDEDGAATLVALTVAAIVRAQRLMPQRPKIWLVCGGGRKNVTIMAQLRKALQDVDLIPVEAIGLEGDFIEAQGFAYLAILARFGLPISLPLTTGVPVPLTGGTYHAPPAGFPKAPERVPENRDDELFLDEMLGLDPEAGDAPLRKNEA